MTIKIIKLVTGEELIVKTEEINKTGYLRISDPIVLVPIPNDEGQSSIAFIRWLPYAKETDGIDIQEIHIIYNVLPSSELESSYREFTSGLITPSTGLDLT